MQCDEEGPIAPPSSRLWKSRGVVYFVNEDAVVSAFNALDLSDINKISRLVVHVVRRMPWPLVEEVSVDTV